MPNSTSTAPACAPASTYDYASGFYLSLQAAGRSTATSRTYREALTGLERFADGMGMPAPAFMTPEHLRHYFLSLFEKGNRPGTVSVRYRALRCFYNWLINEGERRDNPLDRVPAPKPEQRVLPHYEAGDVERLLSATAAAKDVLAPRDAAIILLMYDTGLRAKEVCGLARTDLDIKRMVLRAYGKGNKERMVGIGYRTAQAIERYMRRRQDSGPWLFANWYGAQITYNGLTLALRRRFRQAGVTFGGAHAFRRGFAMSFLDSGGSPEDLRVLAGWDSPLMLRRYTKATEGERALRGHRQHSPADALGKATTRR